MYSHYIPAVHVTDETVDELLTPLPKGSASSSRHILTGEKIRAELNKWEAAGTSLETWRQCKEELELGYVWLDDSCSESQVFLAKRFGLVQKEKVRMTTARLEALTKLSVYPRKTRFMVTKSRQ